MVTMTCYSAPSQVKRAEESTPLQSTLGAMKSALDWLESVHDQVNLDAIIGTRIVEGRSKFLWRPSDVMMPTLSSMVATEVVVITTSGVTSGDKIVISVFLVFQLISVIDFIKNDTKTPHSSIWGTRHGLSLCS